MKNFLISFLVFIALIVLFSFQDTPDEQTTHKGSGTKMQGDSGMVVPGDGAEPVEVILQTEPMEEIPQAEPVEEKEEMKPNPPKAPIANGRSQIIKPPIVVDRAKGINVPRLCNQQVFLLPKRRKWGNTTKKIQGGNPMSKKIFLSPSNQSGNRYAYGDTNEAAECGKMADAAEKALKRCGFQVKKMQWETMQVRCKESDKWGADLHIPIHTNGFDGKVAGTRTMVYKKSGEAYEAAKCIHNELAPITPGKSENITAHPELYELKAPKADAVYLEVDFHDNKEAAKWLIENTEAIGEAICKGICKHFGVKYVAPDAEPEKPVEPKTSGTEAPAHYDTGKAGTYKVKADAGLWLRVGPSTDHEAFELLKVGASVKCLGHYTGVWLRVETQESIVGFCHSDYLEKVE